MLCATHAAGSEVPALPPLRVSSRVLVSTRPREVAIVIENTSIAPISMRTGVGLERREHGVWSVVQAGGLLLRTACDGPPLPSCVTLAARSTLVTTPWLGTVGNAQCVCERCVAAPAGEYRFVPQTCDSRPIAGAPFVIPAR